MTTALVKAEAEKMARGGKKAKRGSKAAERLHNPRKMRVSTSHHKSSHSTIKHGRVKMDMSKGRTRKAI